jgi:hypothetical protein
MRSASGMQPTPGPQLASSELCATCHTLYTHALGSQGEVVGHLPEQVPYLEWLHSSYRRSKSCQTCHLPAADAGTPISSVVGQPRVGFSRHVFRGGNHLMLRMLSRYGVETGVRAHPRELGTSLQRTVQHLQERAARLSFRVVRLLRGHLELRVQVRNLAGHKLPTAYPSRRVWIRLRVLDRQHTVLFESGALTASGAIAGNANDADAGQFEPHHSHITRADQVQIYEAILADPQGSITTGLLTASQFAKDNRILPQGFDKSTASRDVAVHGRAARDATFGAGRDTVRYTLDVSGRPGPFSIQAELYYQPIGYRWAENLRSLRTAETNRFAYYYRSLSGESAVVLARATATIDRPSAEH